MGWLFGVVSLACAANSTTLPPTAVPATATATTVPATPTLAPPTATPAPSIVFSSTVSTVYYDVFGLTTDEIFDSIDANGPRLENDELGLGLASWNYSGLDWRVRAGLNNCGIGSVNLSVDFVVTLPRLVDFDDVSAAIQRRWEDLAAEVAAHEQRHVDIVFEGVENLEQKLRSIQPQASCPALDSRIEALWSEQLILIDEAQETFHAEDEARLQLLRGPFTNQLEANSAQLDAWESQLRSLDAELANDAARLEIIEVDLEILAGELGVITDTYPGGALPPAIYDQFEGLSQNYNGKLAQFNDLVEQYNATLAIRESLAGQHEVLRIETNSIRDQIAWLQ